MRTAEQIAAEDAEIAALEAQVYGESGTDPETGNPPDAMNADGEDDSLRLDTVVVDDDHAPPESADAEEPVKKAEDEESVEAWRQRYETEKQQREVAEHRNDVLNGIIKADGPRNAAELRSLRNELSELRERQDAARESGSAAQTQTVEAEIAELKAGLKETMDEAVVERLFTALEKMTDVRTREAVAPIRQTIEKEQKSNAERAIERFKENLTKAVPDWEKYNTDPEFHKMLGDSGKELLDAAGRALDVKTAQGYFKTFEKLRRAAPAAPASDKDSQDEKTAKAEEERRRRAALAQPKPASTPRTETGGKKRYTVAEFNEIQRKLDSGNLPTDKAKVLEDEIERAVYEGRVA